METIASWIGWLVLCVVLLAGSGIALKLLIPGRWQCAIGLHKLDDCWCVRKGCNYHENTN